ncbi:MAG: clostripain-related cysteine peptidase [Oscillospiraceae bacterium]|nr:clostripain-related cysteine peptidase [Oscillospiraceae bacterium]
MDTNRPKGREKNVTSGGSGAYRRGSGLGSGPVGTGYSDKNSGGGKRAAVGGGGGITLLIVGLLLMKSCFGGGDSASFTEEGLPYHEDTQSSSQSISSEQTQLNQTVASGSREKRTTILGNQQDTVTVMVYICGTDLESKSGMASADIQEMANAKFGDNVNLILYTGGCKEWKINGISSSTNQIYQIKDGKIGCLESDMGNKAMTDPATLSEFIQYCAKRFPANRNELIFWDHGGGSVTGYGYDEKLKNGGSMNLAGISKALKNGGVTFDFVGFDACLMATAETALMMNNYADYMVASEETEPGIGWYYTDWLTKLGSNTSMSTIEIGKNICDDFTSACARRCPGQKTTLSVIDLAEFANTVPANLSAFADSVSAKMANQEYEAVSNARYQTREFAASSKIDQVDLTDLANKMNTAEGRQLASALSGAVKYYRNSSNITNAYGVSIFFPYKRTSYVDNACSTYSQIDMDSSYMNCIRQFASLETSGQIAAGGSGSPLDSIFGGASGGSSGSAEIIGSLLSGFLNSALSGDRSINGLDSSNIEFMEAAPMSESETAEYLSLHYFDANNLYWTENNGSYILRLNEEQWKQVHRLDKNMFYDDGTGYIDLGLDNTYDFDDDNNLIADTDRNWLAVNGQVVAYYHTDTVQNGDDYTISGYIPALLNGDRVKLLTVFDQDHPDGMIIGAETDYRSQETDTVAKSMTELQNGDTLDFVCDYYSYSGDYLDSYYIGEQISVNGDLKLSNVDVGNGPVKITYCFTDMYNKEYWTESISN